MSLRLQEEDSRIDESPRYMCLDNCPQTDQAGNQLVLDVFSRQCLRIKDNPEYRPAAKYEFSRLIGKDVTWVSIYNESNAYVTKLKRYQD